MSRPEESGISCDMRKETVQKNSTYAEIAGASIAAVLAPDNDPLYPNRDAIAKLAYRLWEDRGKPEGSPEYDWFLAEELLRSGVTVSAASS